MIKITPDLVQRLVNYLAKKPYEEVYKLIAEITKQANAVDKKQVPKAPKSPAA